MKKVTIVTLALASCMLLTVPQSAQAFNSIMGDWVAYYNPCQPLVTASCTACHMNGFEFNTYGDAIKTALASNGSWTNEEAFVAVEGIDSDLDGYTNGQEIVVDCTFPADASDHGTVADVPTSWGQIKALYR